MDRPSHAWMGVALGLVVALLPGDGVRAAPAIPVARNVPHVEADQLIAPDGVAGDHFGFAVALDGDTLAVGAPDARVGPDSSRGAVYVYVRSGAAWRLEQKLSGAGGRAGDHLGRAVALSGNLLVAGAPDATVFGTTAQGAAYVFRRTGTAWTEDHRLVGPSGVSGDRFGSAVAVSGSTVVIGAPDEEQANIPDSGVLHVFTGTPGPESETIWTETARLTASDAANNDHLGSSVALDSGRLLAGAPDRDGAGRDEGAAYAFTRRDAIWSEQRLTAAVPGQDDRFGAAVAVDGDDAVVGAPGHDGSSHDEGVVYPYAYAADGWVAGQALPSPQPASNAGFGASVGVASGTLAAGSPRDRAGTGHEGAIYTFSGGAGAWEARQVLTVGAASSQARLGDTIAVSGANIAGGAPEDDVPTANKGSSKQQGSVTAFAEFAAADDAYTTDQGRALTVPAPGVLANDPNPTGGTLSAQLDAAPAHGTVAVGPDGSFTYTPAADFSGADAFSYHALLAGDPSSTATVTITVRPRPVANADSYTTGQDTPLTTTAATGVLANDTSGSGGALTAVIATGAVHGTVALGSDGSFTYTPAAGYSGPDAFTYVAREGTLDSDPTTVSLTVTPAPPPPVAIPDVYAVDQDAALTVTAPEGVLANDVTGSGAPLTAQLVSGPANGTLALNADGAFTYTPNAGFNGPDAFTYRAHDGAGSAQATAAIAVRPPQPVVTPPVANPDQYSTDHETPLTVTAAVGVLANDTGTTLTATLVSGPAHGTLALNPDGSFLYTPATGFFGSDAFTYSAANSAGTAQATATITVRPPPVPPPTAATDAYATVNSTPLTVAAATGVLANDSGRALTATLVTAPQHGALALGPDGAFVYVPVVGYEGPDAFTYEARNAAGADRAVAALVVAPRPNQPPSAGNDAFTTAQDRTLPIAAAQVLANDSDPDGDQLSAASPLPLSHPAHGTLTVASGIAAYTPDIGFSGTDTFTYAVSDGRDSSPPAKVTVTVEPATPPDIIGGGGGSGGGEVIVPTPPSPVAGPPGPAIPLTPGGAPRSCEVRVETLPSASGARVLAQGRAKPKGTRRIAVRTRLTAAGARMLRRTVGGVPARARAICRTARGQILGDVARRRVLPRVEHTRTPAGSWLPDQAVLTASGEKFVHGLARRLDALPVARLRCDGHAAVAPASPVDAHALSLQRAKVACGLLRKALKRRPRTVAHGTAIPIATNSTEAGRSENRRVGITIVYGRRA